MSPSMAAAGSPYAKSGRPPAIAPWSVERHRSGGDVRRPAGRSASSGLSSLARGSNLSRGKRPPQRPFARWFQASGTISSRAKPSQAEPSRAKPSQAEPSHGAAPSRAVSRSRSRYGSRSRRGTARGRGRVGGSGRVEIGLGRPESGRVQPCWASPASSRVSLIGRPTPVPASHAVIGPCWRGCSRYSTTRPSTSERVVSTSVASQRSLSCRLTAGRLRRSSAARLEGRRGPRASAAMIRRRVGSASSSIPGPFRFGIRPKHGPKRSFATQPAIDPAFIANDFVWSKPFERWRWPRTLRQRIEDAAWAREGHARTRRRREGAGRPHETRRRRRGKPREDASTPRGRGKATARPRRGRGKRDEIAAASRPGPLESPGSPVGPSGGEGRRRA